jgi:hypothetical protein
MAKTDERVPRIFVPSGVNPLIDILLARSVTGESPQKKQKTRADCSSLRGKGKRKSIHSSDRSVGQRDGASKHSRTMHARLSNQEVTTAKPTRRTPQSRSCIDARQEDQGNFPPTTAGPYCSHRLLVRNRGRLTYINISQFQDVWLMLHVRSTRKHLRMP